MSKPKYLITNLVYGDTYAKLFCNNHVKSLLDPTNLAAITDKYDVEYKIFTDEPTMRTLNYNPHIVELAKTVTLTNEIFGWPPDVKNKFAYRYGLLLSIFKRSVEMALERNALLTAWVADLVVAQEFFPRVMSRIEDGHGAVFVLPLRAASEAVSPKLQEVHYALPAEQLCALGLECLHPLWVACHWRNPQFSKLPLTLLWQGSGGVLARTVSTTPIIFKPTAAMLTSRGMIDGDIPALCENPYWATDWTDAPVIGVEPLICYYPPFANRPASTQLVRDFLTAPDLAPPSFLEHQCYYPNKAGVQMDPDMLAESNLVVSEIVGASDR